CHFPAPGRPGLARCGNGVLNISDSMTLEIKEHVTSFHHCADNPDLPDVSRLELRSKSKSTHRHAQSPGDLFNRLERRRVPSALDQAQKIHRDSHQLNLP